MGDMGNPYEKDITEINGFDNMHNAELLLKMRLMRRRSFMELMRAGIW